MQKNIDPRGKNVTYEVAFINVDEDSSNIIKKIFGNWNKECHYIQPVY